MRGASLAGAGFILAQALNLAAYIVLARLLTPTEFGVFAGATVLVGFALIVSEGGIGAAVVQRRDRIEEALATAVVTTTVNGILLALVAAAASPLLGLIFDASQVTEVALAMSGLMILRGVASTPNALLQRNFSFLRRLVIEPLQVVVFGVVSVIAASNDMGPWSLVIGQYAGTTADVVLSWALARWRPRLRLANLGMWRELVAYGRHVFGGTVILQAGQQADALIVGPLLGTAQLGQFRYGYRLASTPFQALLAAAAYVLFPAFARISHDLPRFRAAFLRSLRWMSIIALPMSLILVPLGEPLAVIVFGDVWRQAGYAAAAMAALTASGMVSSIVSEGIKAAGRPERLVPMHAVSAGLTAAFMLALVPVGFEAVAAGISLGAAGAAVYAMWTARDILGIPLRDMVRELAPCALAAVVMALALTGIERVVDAESLSTLAGIGALLGEGLAGVVIYLAALAVISKAAIGELREMVEKAIGLASRRVGLRDERPSA